MDSDVGRLSGTPGYAEPVPDQDLDWTWPAADTFTDNSIARWTLQTCSELGSQRIRLIKIRPGRPRDTIECDTKVCFLSEVAEYTALSYTWDSAVTRHQIVMDEQPVQVTVNLWRFLWQARKLPARYSGWLWIDALSINQSDPWEKLEQVEIISSIFESAKGTVVWLGRAYEDSDKAMQALKSKYSSLFSRPSRALWAPPLGPAILRLCERTYWRRLWVLQELKYSHAVVLMCGNRHLHFECLKRLLYTDSFDQRVETKVEALQNSSAAKMANLIPESFETSLLNMLRKTQSLRCADPRDKVYAILKLVVPESRDIKADYTNTLPILANQVLRNTHVSEEPRRLKDVAEQCDTLVFMFHIKPLSLYVTGYEFSRGSWSPLEDLSEPFMTRIDRILEDMYNWCRHYDHRAIARIICRDVNLSLGINVDDMGGRLAGDALVAVLRRYSERKLRQRLKCKTLLSALHEFASSS